MKKFWDNLAWVISTLMTPPLVAAVGILLISYHFSKDSPEIWLWGLLGIFLLIGPASVYILTAYRMGKVHNITLSMREERILPLMMALAGSVIGVLLLETRHAPPSLNALGYALVAELVAIIAITVYWKISVHLMTIATVVTSLIYLQDKRAVFLYFLVLPVAWARIYRHRHTPAQVIAGTILGAGIAFLIFYCSRMVPE